MRYGTLYTVVLDTDYASIAYSKANLGAVVEACEPDGIEVEFVTAPGRTQALDTLSETDVRSVASDDLVSVRPLSRSG